MRKQVSAVRIQIWALIVVVMCCTIPLSAQKKTADGQPDVQGYWGVDRFFTGDLETGQDEAESLAVRGQAAPDPAKAKSVIIDPADGKLPYQPWAQDKRIHIPTFRRGETSRGKFKTVRDLRPQTMCLLGAPRLELYNGFKIVQTPGQIVMLWEWSHGYRVIPLDTSRPHLPPDIKLEMGDARGHWEGNALVVETTNINDWDWFDMTGTFHSSDMTMVERYTFTNAQSMTYEATITDKRVFTRPWTMRVPFRSVSHEPGYEFYEEACVEGEKGAAALLGESPN
jgi:hypothetical protein